jgi:pimeloyl-ACP methyl ester carboxylesterase
MLQLTTPPSAGKPTVVLVHGAFAESASWNGVIDRLQADGFPVVAAANPLRGVQEDSVYVANILESIEGPLVLVGHSYGGVVISHAAEGHDRVRALVYVAAYALDIGESAASIGVPFAGGTLADTLVAFDLPGGQTDLYISQEKFHGQFAADVSADEAALMAAAQRPIVGTALSTHATAAAWKTIPSWFLFGELDRNIPVALHRHMAQRAGSRRTVEVAGGSHAVALPRADEVATLIMQAAQATTPAMTSAA